MKSSGLQKVALDWRQGLSVEVLCCGYRNHPKQLIPAGKLESAKAADSCWEIVSLEERRRYQASTWLYLNVAADLG